MADPSFQAALAEIWASSRPLIDERLARLEEAVVDALGGTLDAEVRRAAAGAAHKLAGSLGTFGFHRETDMAREAEQLLSGDAPLEAAAVLRLATLVEGLGDVRARPGPVAPTAPDAATGPAGHGTPTAPTPPPGRDTPGGTDRQPRLLVVEGDADLAQRIVEQAHARGLRPLAAGDVATARAQWLAEGVDVAVVDTGLAGAAELVAELATAVVAVPVVVHVRDAFSERVRSARLGAASFLAKPTPPAEVVDEVLRWLPRPGRPHVVVVDDDPAVSGAVRAALEREDVEVTTVANAAALWQTAAERTLDAVVLDLDLPGVDGVAVCRTLRADPSRTTVPIVFLTASSSDDSARRVFAAGADDMLRKPIAPEDLVVRVLDRVRRTRRQAGHDDLDATTGLPGAAPFVTTAKRLLATATRTGLATGVAMIGPPPGRARDAARALRAIAHEDDAVGRLDDGSLVLVTAGTTLADMARRTEAAIAELADAGARGAVAVVSSTLDAALAQTAATLATTAAGAVAHGSPVDDDAPAVDVLVVDDDDLVAELVDHAFTARGWSTERLADGAEAAQRLLAPGPPPARVVVLDVGLPGLDGLSVLRQLRASGRLDRVRVVMLTLRSSEQEIIEALEMGAFDHVAKPFSLPVLCHRVQRALRQTQ